MAGELTTKARQIKQALVDLQNAGMQTTANMQNVIAFLDKLASGQTLSGLDYLTKNLRQLTTAMKDMGMAHSEVRKTNTELAQLAKTTRILSKEYNALKTGAGAKVVGTNWLRAQPQGTFANEQEAYRSYLARVKELEGIERSIQERLARKTGQAIPMKQIIDPDLPVVNEEFFKGLGYSSEATDRLRKRLETLGFSSANVTRNLTEASTQITQLRFKTEQAGGNVRTFSVTMDRAGNILDDTQKRFRTFGNAIVRDTVEVLKWSIAIGLVYGPLRKMTELLQQAVKVQSLLADVQIALGKSTTDLGTVFEASARIADETSSSIEGVIDGYQEAYSASGSVANQYQRVATANALLRDSMVLSRLAGIDQSTSLDTLVGALRQSGRELYEGQQLLDGWVAVSKNANVSLNQLASTFAIVGTAAEDVGISVDQLNAIVGTLAEATKLSADETGNAIRGFVSGFQSAKAEETLAKFGISVRTTSGEVRSFVDLMAELSVLSQSGVLSQREVAEITNVIGGGFRRGAQLAALLENFNRVMSLTEISMSANGDAADALDIKMSTLESATTRLGNAFTSMGQALGGKGGVLDIFTGMVNTSTKVVQSITSLVNVLEGAAPILATLGLLSIVGRTGTGIGYLSKGLPTLLSYAFSQNLGQQAATGTPTTAPPGLGIAGGIPLQAGAKGFGSPTWLDLGRTINNYVSKALSKIPLFGGKLAPLGAAGLAVPGILAGTQLLQGEPGKAGATIGGSFLAAVASGGSTIWTAAGAIIAGAFYDKFIEFEPNFAQRWADLIIDAQRAEDTSGVVTPEERRQSIADLEKEVVDTLGWQERLAVNTRTFFLNQAENFRGLVNATWGEQIFNLSDKKLTNVDLLTQAFFKQRAGETAPGGVEGLIFGGGAPGTPILDDNTYNALKDLINEFMIEQVEQGITKTKTQQAVISTQQELAFIAATAATDLVEKALDDISKGVKGSVEQYIDASRIQTALSLSAAQLIVAIQTAISEVPSTTLEVPTQQAAVGFVAGLDQEQARVLTQLTGEITTNFEKINILTNKGFLTSEEQLAMSKYREDLEAAVGSLENLLPSLQQATALRESQLLIKPIIDLPDKLSGAEQLDIIQKAERYWRYVLEKQGLSEEQIEAYINAEQEKLIRADREILDYRTKAPADIVSTVVDQLGLGKDTPFQFVDLRDRLGLGQIDQLLLRYQQISTAFKQNVPGFELEMTPVTLILKEGFKNLDLDMRLFNLAMQDLIDIEEKQLVEGMFNLPSGATFFVPFEPASLDARSRANQALSELDQESLFAQYAPDPNAMEAAVKEGAMEGVLAGFEGASARDKEQSEKWNNLLRDRIFPEPEEEEGWRIPQKLPIPYNRAPGPAQFTGPEGGGFLAPVWKTLLGNFAGGVVAEAFGSIGDAVGSFLLEGAEAIKETFLQGYQNEDGLQMRQKDEPLKKGDLTTYLNLQISSTSNLILNEQQIGQAVQSYLEQSLLRFDDTAGSVNKVVTV